jgi:hypothetical protein
MTGSATHAARFARIQAALTENRQPAPDDVEWVLSIDAESVRRRPGTEGLEEAKRLIVEFARKFCLTSLQMHACIARYETSAWPRERLLDECPRLRVGRPEEFCWKILRAYRAPSDRTIRRILELETVAKSSRAMASDHR